MPVLNALPTETIFHSGDPNVCIDAYEGLQEPQKSLLGWLLHLMADVASLKPKNKMSEQNLGKQFSPSLQVFGIVLKLVTYGDILLSLSLSL